MLLIHAKRIGLSNVSWSRWRLLNDYTAGLSTLSLKQSHEISWALRRWQSGDVCELPAESRRRRPALDEPTYSPQHTQHSYHPLWLAECFPVFIYRYLSCAWHWHKFYEYLARLSSGVARLGTRALPTLAMVGLRIRRDSKFSGVMLSDSATNLQVHTVYFWCCRLLGKCIYQLQIAYVYLDSGRFAPDPIGVCPWTPLGYFHPLDPDSLCPPYLQTLAMPQ